MGLVRCCCWPVVFVRATDLARWLRAALANWRKWARALPADDGHPSGWRLLWRSRATATGGAGRLLLFWSCVCAAAAAAAVGQWRRLEMGSGAGTAAASLCARLLKGRAGARHTLAGAHTRTHARAHTRAHTHARTHTQSGAGRPAQQSGSLLFWAGAHDARALVCAPACACERHARRRPASRRFAAARTQAQSCKQLFAQAHKRQRSGWRAAGQWPRARPARECATRRCCCRWPDACPRSYVSAPQTTGPLCARAAPSAPSCALSLARARRQDNATPPRQRHAPGRRQQARPGAAAPQRHTAPPHTGRPALSVARSCLSHELAKLRRPPSQPEAAGAHSAKPDRFAALANNSNWPLALVLVGPTLAPAGRRELLVSQGHSR